MNDYRLEYPNDAAVAAHRSGVQKHPWLEWLEQERPHGFVTGPLPPDRRGLLAAMHDRCCVTDEQIAAFNNVAASIAKETGRRVYVTFTRSRWHLILLAIEFPPDRDHDTAYIWFDDTEPRASNEPVYAGDPSAVGDRVYADDQYIAHYEPDGSWHFDGCS